VKKTRRSQYNRGALELIEEATHLLRTAPLSLLVVYYIGALPFVLGLLFFVADMGSNPYAKHHIAEASLGLALFFLWMKFWQTLFARRAHSQITGIPAPRLTVRGGLRIFAAQLAFQPLGLILIPLAAVLTVPFAWVYSFFQNVTVLADGSPLDFKRLFRRALKQCALWPAENQAIKFTMFGFIILVFLNWTIMGLVAPWLLKKLLGIETVFSRSPWAMLNSTFFAAMLALTYLSVDPILKLIHVLRCFYGEALTDGADLKAELRRNPAPASAAMSLLVLGYVLLAVAPAGAQESAAPANKPLPSAGAVPAVNPPELDRAIHDVVSQRKYTWRMPREEVEQLEAAKAREPGVIANFFEGIGKMLGKAVTAVSRVIETVMRKIFGGFNPKPISMDTGFSWMAFQRLLLYLLGFAVIGAVIYLAYRIWRHRQSRGEEVLEAAPLPTVPDVRDENVGADQLPEDGWTRLARELWERGEFRLALRAFYLASLAHLAARNLITLARFKSNREYQQELQRRGHALTEVLPPFSENLSAFERVWYGTHTVGQETVAQFAANVERIKAIA